MIKSKIELDLKLGLEYFITDTEPIGGKLREKPEDFFVEEVIEDKNLSEDSREEKPYLHFTLEKKNWDTIRAIDSIARALRVSRKRFSFAGTKDRRAITKQRVSAYKLSEEDLRKVSLKDIKIYDFEYREKPIKLGALLGNRFEIILRNAERNGGIIKECISQLEERGIPNYFGYQRFGVIRPNTHLIGKAIISGDLEKAVMIYLAEAYERESEEAKHARNFLKETKDFKKAIEIFPKELGYERTMLAHLSAHPRDFAGAIRKLNRNLRLMFVHAYQSYLFNKLLSRAMEREIELKDVYLNVFGYETELSRDKEIREIEEEVLEEEGIKIEDFKIKKIPELSSRGMKRKALIFEKIDFEKIGENDYEFKFFLPKACYATSVMREFMKTSPLNY